MTLKLRLLSLLLIFSTFTFAQRLRSFSPDKVAYRAELEDFLKDMRIDDKDELERLLLEFTNVWNSPGITAEEESEIYEISNNFLKRRMNSFTGWSDFLLTIVHLELEEDEKLLLPWLENLNKLSADKSSRITEDFLHASYLTFTENTLFDDGRSRWSVRNADFNFSYEGEPVFTFKDADLWGYFKDDSTQLEKTSFTYYPMQHRILGNGGKSYFTRAGLSKDSAHVELNDYQIDVRKTDFRADSVKLVTQMLWGHTRKN